MQTHLSLRALLGPTAGVVAAVSLVLAPVAVAKTANQGRGASRSQGAKANAAAPYGEVTRFGGFDTKFYNNAGYNGNSGKPVAGKLVDPVGFAVDPTDTANGSGGAVYVLDRVSKLPGNLGATQSTTWRIQKFSDTGTVLGTDEFTLPVGNAQSAANYYYEMQGLTVDPATHSVYAMIVDTNAELANTAGHGGDGEQVQSGSEIIGWSTQPAAGGLLNGAAGLPADTISKPVAGFGTPAVLSNVTQLGGTTQTSANFPEVEEPQGMALDVVGAARYLAVDGGDPANYTDGGGTGVGNGIVQVCESGCSSVGAITGTWSGSTATSELATDKLNISDDSNPPAGISTAADGSLLVQVGMPHPAGWGSDDIYDVPANLPETGTALDLGDSDALNCTSTTAASCTVTDPVGELETLQDQGGSNEQDTDNAALGIPLSMGILTGDANGDQNGTDLPSQELISLSNGLDASVFESGYGGSGDSENPAGTDAPWTTSNPAIRLLQPEAGNGGALTNPLPPLQSLVGTLGNQTHNTSPAAAPVTAAASACSLTDATTDAAVQSSFNAASSDPSLAAGANGTLWVMTRGSESSLSSIGDANGNADPVGGRQIIELSPGAGSPCPTPSGTFSEAVNGGASQPASGSLALNAGDLVTFDASKVNYQGGASSELTWNFGADGTTNVYDASPSAEASDTWPSPTITHVFKNAGTFNVTLSIHGDYGVYTVASGTITVGAGNLPTAAFSVTPSTAVANTTVSFDGSASSSPVSGRTIAAYNWDFGDGDTEQTTTPTDTHVFTTPGTYNVTLSVVDSDNATSPTVSEPVTITALAVTTTTTTATTTTPPPPATTTTTTTTTTPPPTNNGVLAPAVATKFTAVTSKTGVVAVTVSCPKGQTQCSGSVTLRTATAVAAAAGKSKKVHKSVLTLGSASFKLAGGKSATLHIALHGKALTLLRKSHSIRALATITASNPQGKKYSKTAKVTVRLPVTKPKKHK